MRTCPKLLISLAGDILKIMFSIVDPLFDLNLPAKSGGHCLRFHRNHLDLRKKSHLLRCCVPDLLPLVGRRPQRTPCVRRRPGASNLRLIQRSHVNPLGKMSTRPAVDQRVAVDRIPSIDWRAEVDRRQGIDRRTTMDQFPMIDWLPEIEMADRMD
jgi:hypothetical protein